MYCAIFTLDTKKHGDRRVKMNPPAMYRCFIKADTREEAMVNLTREIYKLTDARLLAELIGHSNLVMFQCALMDQVPREVFPEAVCENETFRALVKERLQEIMDHALNEV